MKCSNTIVPGMEQTSKIKNKPLEMKYDSLINAVEVDADTESSKSESQIKAQQVMLYINKARGNKDAMNKTRKRLFEKAVIETDADSFVFVSPKKGTQKGPKLDIPEYGAGLSVIENSDFSIETKRHRIGINDDAMMVKRVIVEPEYRRMGIAVDLYLAAIEDARRKGLDLVSDYDVRPEAAMVYAKLQQLSEEKDLGFTVGMNAGAKVPSRKGYLLVVSDYIHGENEPVMRILIDKQYNH